METVLKIFTNFKARRSALITALTTEAEELYQLCGDKTHNLCLYGYPNKQWQVAPPVEMVPPDLPEPTIGINFPRDEMEKRDWLSLVAIHSDSWLLAIAKYYGSIFGDKDDRKHLFALINELPTIYEVVSATAKESETKSNTIGGLDEEGHTVCGACGGNDGQSEFWICCDVCEKWFHGKCMKIYPETVHILQYKCRACSSS